MKKLYLVDVSSFFFRAYFAIPPLSNKDGIPTNALYGFMNMVIKLLREIKPDYIAFCFDRKEKSFRFDKYPEYKANRSEMPDDLVPQVPYLRKLTDLMGIPRFDKLGYEADDVIGSLSEYGRSKNLEVVIVSGDKDFAQLVDPFVIMYDTMKDKKYDIEGVVEKWGIKPEQMIDYLAMVGDSSDNIPGVRGVGPKGAQKLLAEFKTLDGIYENLDKVPGKSTKAKLAEHKEMAYLSRELVTIVKDIPFDITPEDLKLKTIDKAALSEALLELNFKSFEKSLIGENNGFSKDESSSSSASSKSGSSKKTSKKSKAKKSKDISEIKEDTATAETLDKKIAPYSEVVAMKGDRGIYLMTGSHIWNLPTEKEIGQVLGKKNLSWSGFELKNIWREIHLSKPVTPKMDLMLASYVAMSVAISTFEQAYELFLGKKIPDLAEGKQLLTCYAELVPFVMDRLDEIDGHKVLTQLELPLVPVLYEMEREGILLDVEELKKQSEELHSEIESLEKEIFKHSGEAFNISSPKQLGHILFEKLGLPVIKKTKTGFSTNAEVLEKLKDQHPICEKVIDYREHTKLSSTYVDALPKLVNPETKRIHTSLRQAVTTTGRLSSVNPNLQNIPIRTARGRKIRRAFTADKGNVLLSIDYSQIELRILAHITGDDSLRKAFANDLDIHAATASEIFGVSLEDVDSELRRRAKAVNFGIAYGQGAYGLSENLGISRGEAKEIIDNYFDKFKAVKEYMESTIEQARTQGYVTTMFGRKRFIKDINSKNGNLRSFAERAAINAPMQGTASDLMKKAMIEVYENIDCKMLLQVHDELLFEVEEDEVVELAKELKDILENVESLSIPLKANVAWGSNWEDAHA